MSIYSSAFPFRRHALALALALASGASNAATINVSGACTLVNAINNANSDTDTDGAVGCPAGSGADTLELETNAAHTLTTVDNVTDGPNGLPSITSTITINGHGAIINRSNEAGTPLFRLLHIAATGNLTLNQIKLTGGNNSFGGDDGGGGGILNRGTLHLIDSTLSGNSAFGPGGGLYDNGSGIEVTNSTISGNSSNIGGGGISSFGNAVAVTNSVISGNTANSVWDGGGFFAGDGTHITITNSTISDNIGGGFSNHWSGAIIELANSNISGNSGNGFTIQDFGSGSFIEMTNCTVSGNTGLAVSNRYGGARITHSTISNNGGALYGYAGAIELTNSIIANNSFCDYDYSYNIILTGINLIEDGGCGAPLSGDPKLRTLLDNGGPTLTHALPGHSPAIAAADPTLCEAADQRGVRRPRSCDLGAFERKSKIPKSIAPLVEFFDAQVESNGLSGHVAGETVDRRIALRNQLLTAGDYRNRDLKTDACAQLTRTLGYIDPDNKPEADDYVTGSGGGLLIDEINALRSNWSCS